MADREKAQSASPAPEPAAPGLEPTLRPELDDTAISGGGKAAERLARGTAVGRYLLLELVGEGGMGSVYSAYDPDLGRKVAIKLLKVSGEDAQEARGRLLREAQAMARLSHPNVLPVFDAGLFGEQLFVAMELVEGSTLAQWLRSARRPRREILRKFLAAGDGLAAAHEKGLVHRDFKPENVLVGQDGRPRVTDFGLAHVETVEEPSGVKARPGDPASGSSSHTFAGSISGTPAYMAPEQFLGAATDARTDQFSFCVSLWEALCGERPFAGEDFGTLRLHVCTRQMRPPPPSLPRSLRAVLLKGLSAKPEDRFPSLDDLLRALRRDPAEVVRKLAPWALLGALIAGSGAALVWDRHLQSHRCERETAAEVDQFWPPARRAEASQTMAANGFEAAATESVLREVDGRVQAWAGAHRTACESARQGLPQAIPAHECLDRKRARLEATVALLSKDTKIAPSSLGVVVDQLEDPADCVEQRAGTVPPAEEPLARLRTAVAECSVLADLARYGEAVERARALLPQARAANALSEAAELELVVGYGLWRSQGTAEVLAHLRQAARDADASGHDELSLRTRIMLMNFLTLGEVKLDAAEQVARECEAWLVRLGKPGRLEQPYAIALADLLSEQKRHEESVASYRRAVELAQKASTRRASQLARARNDLATQLVRMRRHAEAAQELQACLGLYQEVPHLSPLNHTIAWGNLAYVRIFQGRLDEALASLDRGEAALAPVLAQAEPFKLWLTIVRGEALELQGATAKAGAAFAEGIAKREVLDVNSVVEALAGRARLLAREGKGAEALPLAKDAWEQAKDLAEPFTVGQAALALAQARWATGDPVGAVQAARTALDQFPGPEDGFMRGQVETWLKSQAIELGKK